MNAKVTIRPSDAIGEVSPFVYGHFTEHLVNVVYDGMWSELIYGRKFETPMVGRLAHPIADPWSAFDPAAAGVAYLRGTVPLPRHAPSHGDCHHSQAIVWTTAHAGGENGITAPDIRVDAGVTYVFRAKVRRTGPADVLRVALRGADGAVLGQAEVPLEPIRTTMFNDLSFNVPTLLWMDPISWHEVSGTITPTGTDHAGTIALTVDVPAGEEAAVWFDWVGLMPADNVDGWHPEVVEELRALPARMLKWPGGCMADDYDWRLGIGPRDSRHCDIDRAWLGWDENDVGTDEFLGLCELTGIEPYIGVNAGSGTPELAAAWVEYVNGPADSEWGRLRAANGHPEPYGVKYWSVGNEQWGHFERGYVGPTGYAERFLQFAEAMRKADPSIVVVAVGQNGPFNEEVLRLAGPAIDLLQIHHYAPEVEGTDDASATAKILAARTFDTHLAVTKAQIEAAGAGHITVALDEWGWGRETHAGSMFNAVALNAMHRAAPLVALGSRSCAVNADGLVTRNGATVTRNGVYEIFRLYNEAHLPQAVGVNVDDDTLDVSALADPSSGRLSIFIVNTGADDRTVSIDTGSDTTSAVIDLVAPGASGAWGGSSPTSRSDVTLEEPVLVPAHSLAVVRVA